MCALESICLQPEPKSFTTEPPRRDHPLETIYRFLEHMRCNWTFTEIRRVLSNFRAALLMKDLRESSQPCHQQRTSILAVATFPPAKSHYFHPIARLRSVFETRHTPVHDSNLKPDPIILYSILTTWATHFITLDYKVTASHREPERLSFSDLNATEKIGLSCGSAFRMLRPEKISKESLF